MKKCYKCKQTLDTTHFTKNKHKRDGLQSSCRECMHAYVKSWRARNLERDGYGTRARKYGISRDDVISLVTKCDSKCQICQRVLSASEIRIDHDHACCSGEQACGKCIRGILCNNCNTGLGYFGDDVTRLSAAMIYLSG